MILQLDPNTRRLLVTCRCLAMRGESDLAISKIDEMLVLSDEIPVLDQVVLLLLKAEIFYLDCREADSLEVFRVAIDPKLSVLSQEIRFIIGQNKSDVAIELIVADSFRQADSLYDQRQLAGATFWDPESMVYAYEAAARGRHYEALPALWRELNKSYHQGGWRYYRQASKRLAREFLQIGWAHSADYHVIVAQDSETAKLISANLLNWRQPQLIERMIQRLLVAANLKRHATVACTIIANVADAIPDDQVANVLLWLLHKCAIVPNGWAGLGFATSVWNAIQSLTPRLNGEQARAIVQTATQHPSWISSDRLTEHIVRAVDDCLDALPLDDLPEIALRAIPLAPSDPEDINYDEDILHLLRHIAFLGDNSIKNQIGDALYRGSSVNLELVRLAHEFGKTLENDEQATRMAEHFADDIRLQVQHLAPGEEFKKPEISLGTLTSQKGDERVAVSMYSGMGLEAVIAYRKLLSPETIQLFVEAILEMIREPENTLANKVGLINGIIELADSITPELAEKIFETLAPPASGHVIGLDITGAVGDPNHPLNPHKVRLGEAADVQGGALYALACIEAQQTGIYGERFTQLLEQAIANPNGKVRKLAFTTAHRAPTLSETLSMRALLGTRDNDPEVAAEAFLAVNNHPLSTDNFWDLLIDSLAIACGSPNVIVRRVAAFTINNLRSQYPNEEARNKLQVLEAALARDLCYSVRRQISLAASEAE